MRERWIFVAGVGLAGVAGWSAHAAWTSNSGSALPGLPSAEDELSARLAQADRQERRQVEALAALQRELRQLREALERGAAPDGMPADGAPLQEVAREGAGKAAGEDPALAPTLTQSRAASEAERIVHHATIEGRWTDGDSHLLEEQLRLMAPEDADELRRSVIASLNRGELEIAFTERPAF